MTLFRRAGLKFHCRYGDARAAVVISSNPLIISAYSDEFDGVKLLEFPAFLAEELGLKKGSTLISINTYSNEGTCRGIYPRTRQGDRNFNDFFPVIGELVSSDVARMEQLRSEITRSEYEATYRLGKECLATASALVQNGLPYLDSLSDVSHPGSKPIGDEVLSSSVASAGKSVTANSGTTSGPKRVRPSQREQMPLNWGVALPVFFVGAFSIAYAIRLIIHPHDPSSGTGERVRASAAIFNWLYSVGGHWTVVSGLLLLGVLLLFGSYLVLKNKITDTAK